MTARPSLVRSIPFWILLAGSLASTAVGIWLVVDKISLMNTTLTDGSATGVEVYGGQAWVTLGAALVGAGLVGLVATLFLGVLRRFVPVTSVETEPVADEIAYEPVVASTDAAAPAPAVAPAAAPAVAAAPYAGETDAAPAAPAAGYTPAPVEPADEPTRSA